MPEDRWRLEVTRRGLAPLSALLPEAEAAEDDLDGWQDCEDIPDGVPFLISPGLEYDVDLNRYFLRPALAGASRNTQLAAAGDVRRFLDFLWCSRGGRGWRDDVIDYLGRRWPDPRKDGVPGYSDGELAGRYRNAPGTMTAAEQLRAREQAAIAETGIVPHPGGAHRGPALAVGAGTAPVPHHR